MGEIVHRALSSLTKIIPQTSTSPGTVVFTVTGSPIEIHSLIIEIVTTVGATACTVQWATVDTVSSTTQTISGATADIQTKVAGISISVTPVALSTAPIISAAGGSALINASAGNTKLGELLMMPGTCNLITSGSPTGTIKYHLTYLPLGKHGNVVMS